MIFSQQVNAIGAKLSIDRNPSESILARFYLLAEFEGLLPVIWSADGVPSVSAFLAEAASKKTVYTAGFVEYPGEPPALAGLCWAFDIVPLGKTGRCRATIGVGFLRQFSRGNIPHELATLALDDLFEKRGLQVAYSFVPAPNRAGSIFASKMRFKKVGVAPLFGCWQGGPCDLVLSYMTREMWNSPTDAGGSL